MHTRCLRDIYVAAKARNWIQRSKVSQDVRASEILSICKKKKKHERMSSLKKV